MNGIEKIRKEYENALTKRQDLSRKLRELEKDAPSDLHEIWMTRDRLAYWEGKAEGLKIALDNLS